MTSDAAAGESAARLTEAERLEVVRADGLRERLVELAEDFESNVDWPDGRSNYGDNQAWESAARQVRDLLAAAPEPAPRVRSCNEVHPQFDVYHPDGH